MPIFKFKPLCGAAGNPAALFFRRSAFGAALSFRRAAFYRTPGSEDFPRRRDPLLQAGENHAKILLH